MKKVLVLLLVLFSLSSQAQDSTAIVKEYLHSDMIERAVINNRGTDFIMIHSKWIKLKSSFRSSKLELLRNRNVIFTSKDGVYYISSLVNGKYTLIDKGVVYYVRRKTKS